MLAVTGALGGCASHPANPDDPLEGYNRAMFSFNERLDRAVMRPVAQAYDAVTPLPVRTGVGNFFGNLGDVWVGGNNLLQGKLGDGFGDLARFVVNTTIGILGVFDVATEVGLVKHDEDFGQTLGRWGVGEGAYVVVPFFGPRTVRDAVALPLDLYADDLWAVRDVPLHNSLTALRFVHARANLLGAEKTLEEGTLDKYAYARDFYLQQRRYKVFDGNPPVENFDLESSAPPLGDATDRGAFAAVGRFQLVSFGRPESSVAPSVNR